MTIKKHSGIRPNSHEQQRRIMMQARYEGERKEDAETMECHVVEGEVEKETEEDECQQGGEEVLIKVVKDPGLPTEAERERHNMTHNPFRSWCPICVEPRGKEDPHHRKKGKTNPEDD